MADQVDIPLESGVPMPSIKSKFVNVLEIMEVGQSFVFHKSETGQVRAVAQRLMKTQGKGFSQRQLKEDKSLLRIWRVK